MVILREERERHRQEGRLAQKKEDLQWSNQRVNDHQLTKLEALANHYDTYTRIFNKSNQGSLEWSLEGFLERSQGFLEGSLDGLLEGSLEGLLEGSLEGFLEGSLDGFLEGSIEGF